MQPAPPLTSTPMAEADRRKIRLQWRKDDEYRCATCSGPAFVEPIEPHRWGCPTCGFATYSVSIYFKKRGQEAA